MNTAIVQPIRYMDSFRASVIHTPLFYANSGLGSCSQRACVSGTEDLRHVCLLLSVSSHHRSWLAFLSAISGSGSGSTSYAPGASCPLQTPSQEEPVTFKLPIIMAVIGCLLVAVGHYSAAVCYTVDCELYRICFLGWNWPSMAINGINLMGKVIGLFYHL